MYASKALMPISRTAADGMEKIFMKISSLCGPSSRSFYQHLDLVDWPKILGQSFV
jgi:hypothetical protein